MDYRGRVIDIFFSVHEADNRGDSSRRLCDLGKAPQVFVYEVRFQKKVFGRVSGYDKLGKNHYVGFFLFSAPGEIKTFPAFLPMEPTVGFICAIAIRSFMGKD